MEKSPHDISNLQIYWPKKPIGKYEQSFVINIVFAGSKLKS